MTNVTRFVRNTVRRSANIVRRVGKTTRGAVSGTVRRSENVLRRVGRSTRRVVRKGTNTVGLTKRRSTGRRSVRRHSRK